MLDHNQVTTVPMPWKTGCRMFCQTETKTPPSHLKRATVRFQPSASTLSHSQIEASAIHSQAVMMPLRNQSTLFHAQISAVTRAAIPATHKPTGLAAIEMFKALKASLSFTTTV